MWFECPWFLGCSKTETNILITLALKCEVSVYDMKNINLNAAVKKMSLEEIAKEKEKLEAQMVGTTIGSKKGEKLADYYTQLITTEALIAAEESIQTRIRFYRDIKRY